jgi:hypothetical protein
MLVVSTAAIALTLATSGHAQTSRQSEMRTPKAGMAKQQRTRNNSNDAQRAYGQGQSERAPNEQQSGECFIPVDKDNDLGYWGSCSTKGARSVK